MKYIAAKADRRDKGRWLSIYRHLEDTGKVMEYLLENFISPSVYEASGISPELFQKIALFTAYTHDIGKATSAFQQKMVEALSDYKTHLVEFGFSIKTTGFEDKTPHALAGAAILNQLFQIDNSICEIIAAHHGKPQDIGKVYKYTYQMKVLADNYYTDESQENYKDTWKEIYCNAIRKSDVTSIKDIPVRAQMIITGLLVMADWIASCDEYFPLTEIFCDDVSENRFNLAMERLKLQSYQQFDTMYMDADSFAQKFGFTPNSMQSAVLNSVNMVTTPGIIIIKAPMGIGKTEAALAAAEVSGAKAGTGGVFFGLPTRGTADAMFGRVHEWAGSMSEHSYSSILLAHSNASYNESFCELKTNIYDEEPAYGVSVNAWMTGRYRKLLPSFVVGTVDQALFTVLKKKFLMLLHLGIVGKTVIIDEVHSYDDYMTEYMKSMLSWLGAYKIPVILLSATLTKEREGEFVSAYTGHEDEGLTGAYPSITWSDAEEVYQVSIPSTDVRHMTVNIRQLGSESISEMLKKLLFDGGCVGIICDTVGHSQQMFLELSAELGNDYELILLHSRFLPKDRALHEKEVLERVGKKGIKRDKVIVIGTQVLEQSLDIDFDVIFTDKCPIDLFFQRLGRLHRHPGRIRPAKVKNPVCYILTDEISIKSAEIYEKYIIRRTDEVLAENDTISIPESIQKLIEDTYDLQMGSDGKDKQDYLIHRDELRRRAHAYLLPSAKECRYKGMLTIENEGKNDSVRIGINTVSPILLKKKEDGLWTFSGMRIPDDGMITAELVRELHENQLSLRYDDELEDVIKTDSSCCTHLKQNVYLEDKDFLLGDEEGHFHIGKHVYSYTEKLGWKKKI